LKPSSDFDWLILTVPKFHAILIRMVGVGVHTESTRHVGHFWPIVPAPGDCEDERFGGLKIGRGTEVLGENLPDSRGFHALLNLKPCPHFTV
jgi:hypothetical protein